MSETKTFKCDKCSREYSRESFYIKHVAGCTGAVDAPKKVPTDVRFRKPRTKKPKPIKCEICAHGYETMVDFQKHRCVTRLMEKDTREFSIGFDIWKKACNHYRIRISAKRPIIDSYILSADYNTYMEFAKYLLNTLIIDRDSYIDYVILNSIPMKDWMKNETITNWTISYLVKEPPTDGITRSIQALQQWQSDTGNDWNTIFNNMTPDRFIMWLQSAKLSPWIIYATNNSSVMLARMTESELSAIMPYINPDVWNAKKMRYRDEVRKIQTALLEVGL